MAQGHSHCEWEIKDVDSWGDEASEWIDILHSNHESIHKKLEEKSYDFAELNKNLEKEVKNRTKKIEEQQALLATSSRLSSLGEMAGGIAHEINNPLAIIAGNAYLIRKGINKGNLSEDFLDSALETIEETVNRIKKIIDGLRIISREPTCSFKDSVMLKDIFTDIISISHEKFIKQGIQLSIDLDNTLFQNKVLCDRVQLSQVFINLLSNAFDAVSQLKKKWINIKIEEEEKFNVLTFTDSGFGISKEVQLKMFDPFYTSKDIGKGTGLGLSISTSVINKLNGTLKLDSKCPNTSFVIKLPKP